MQCSGSHETLRTSHFVKMRIFTEYEDESCCRPRCCLLSTQGALVIAGGCGNSAYGLHGAGEQAKLNFVRCPVAQGSAVFVYVWGQGLSRRGSLGITARRCGSARRGGKNKKKREGKEKVTHWRRRCSLGASKRGLVAGLPLL